MHHHPELTGQTVREVFEAERPKLVPYAGRFDGFHAVPASVSKTCLVHFDNNKYSVAASAAGRRGALAPPSCCSSHWQAKLAAEKRWKCRFCRTILPFATETS
jgi:hypothetical protein